MAQEKRFFEIDLLMTTPPAIDPDWQSTKHLYSRQDVNHWVTQLHDIQRLNATRGLDYAAFHSMRSSPNTREQAMGQTHHKFYDHGDANNDHVKAIFDGQSFKIIDNGRHRVHAAQETQLRWMPAEVSAEPDLMETARRHGRQSTLQHPSDRAIPATPTQSQEQAAPGVKPVWTREQTSPSALQRKPSR